MTPIVMQRVGIQLGIEAKKLTKEQLEAGSDDEATTEGNDK
jgi:hypothetical protein